MIMTGIFLMGLVGGATLGFICAGCMCAARESELEMDRTAMFEDNE